MAMLKNTAGRRCRHPDGEQHHCELVDAVNALIPLAVELATNEVPEVDAVVPKRVSPKETVARAEIELRWSGAFHRWMNKLAQERGLRTIQRGETLPVRGQHELSANHSGR